MAAKPQVIIMFPYVGLNGLRVQFLAKQEVASIVYLYKSSNLFQ